MKILVVHPYLSDIGGAEQVLTNVLDALTAENHEVLILSEPPQKYGYDKISSLPVTNIPYDASSGFELKRFQAYRKLIFKHDSLKKQLRKKIGSVDLEISTQDPMFFIGVGRKQVAYIHFPENITRLMEGGNRSSMRFWKAFYFAIKLRLKQRVRHVDLLMCNSQYTKSAIKRYWSMNAVVVYPPVDVTNFYPAPKENFIVSVGRFVPTKKYELIAQVAKMMPHQKFVIIGRRRPGDTYYEKIAAIKPANLQLIDDASRPQIIDTLSRAKIYLHAMVGEHFGISIVEAMAAGCIPVVHNSGGPKEAMGPYGYTYNNAVECVECINKALASKHDPKEITERAKLFSSENFKKNFINTLKSHDLM